MLKKLDKHKDAAVWSRSAAHNHNMCIDAEIIRPMI